MNRSEDYYFDVAGKGVNVARVLTQLGENATHLTYTGGRDADLYLDMCRDARLTVSDVAGGTGIRTCITVIDRATESTTELIEPTPKVEAGTEGRIVERFRSLLPSVATVVLTGSIAPGFSLELYAQLTEIAREAGAYVCVDYRGEALKKTLQNGEKHLPNMIKINMAEFVQTFFPRPVDVLEAQDRSTPGSREEELLAEAETHFVALRSRGVDVVVTRGARSTLYLDDAGSLQRFSTIPLKPVNTIGCGDAFIAGLLSERADTASSMEEAIERAHTVAGMNATKVRPGTIIDDA